MAISSIQEIWQGRDGEMGVDGVRTYTRVFRVQTNSNFDTAATILTAGGIPRVGDFFPDDIAAFCQRVRPSQESFSPRVWIVTCSYSTKRELQDNPLDDPAEITWDTEQFQAPAIVDKNGDLIVNSAGMPFVPPAMKDESRRTITVKKNLSAVPTWLLDYEDAINSAAFTIDGFSVAAKKAKCQKVSISPWQTRNDIHYRSVTISIHLNKAGWEKRILDAGLVQLDPADPVKRIAIELDDGTEASSPYPLDGSGQALADPTLGSVVFLTKAVYDELPFSALPLS